MQPRPYQLEGRDFLAARRHALLADEMRVGKTPQAILAAHKVGAQRLAVICPAVAVPHWEREFKKWWPADGTPLPSCMIRSFESARKYRALFTNKRWDLLIVDEAHYAKNPNAERTRMIFAKEGIGWCADRIWCLTGTPAPRHAGELWPILRAFGVVGMRYNEFVQRYCYMDRKREVILGTREDRIPELRELLAKIMLRRTRAQVAPEIPRIAFELLPVRPVLDALELERGMSLPDDPEAAARWLEDNSAHLAEWRIAVARAKVPPLTSEIITCLDAKTYTQTVVFGHHAQPLLELCNALRKDGKRAELLTGATPRAQREAIQARFMAGETEVVCGNILAAGTAIDLSAAWHGYFLELMGTPGNNLQAANRLVSLDKARPVSYDVVCWDGSWDSKIQAALARRVRELDQLY